jgi:hypothetical protein
VGFHEILANYQVATAPHTADIKLVVLIQSSELNKFTSIDRDLLRAHETVLSLALLDDALRPGFAAARFMDAKDRACRILCEGCSCGTDVTIPISGTEWDGVVTAAHTLVDTANKLPTTLVRFPASILEASIGGQAGVSDVERYLFRKSLEANASSLISQILSVGISAGTSGAPSVQQIQALGAIASGISAETRAKLASDDAVASATASYIFVFTITNILLGDPIGSGLVLLGVKNNTQDLKKFEDDGFLAALNAFSTAYDNWDKRIKEDQAKQQAQAELARIAKEEREIRILETFGLRDIAEAEERLGALLAHVNDPRNLDHYRFAIWNERSAGSDSQLIALALAGKTEATPIGIVADQLAVPVRLSYDRKLKDFFDRAVADLMAGVQPDVQSVILPTAALYAEALVGNCCACDELEFERYSLGLQRMRLENGLLGLEKERLNARLHADPPLLDESPPQPPTFEVVVRRKTEKHDRDRRAAADSAPSDGGGTGAEPAAE